MADIEVHIELDSSVRRVGTLHRNPGRGGESPSFEYASGWLEDPGAYALEPMLMRTAGAFVPRPGLRLFGSIGDSAPDTWGRRLMQRGERRLAARDGRAVRTLTEIDYLLGVADETRLGALRFRQAPDMPFLAPPRLGVPPLVELGRLLGITDRVLRDEETDEDFQIILAPGSSLGGARPKASVLDQHGRLSIAKFPKETDDYSVESWQEIALRLAERAGIDTPEHQLIQVAGRAVLVSRRFDRAGRSRIPFVSAMTMTGSRDGEQGSYPELVDVLASHGSQSGADAHALYRRMVFNVLISNVDDHLRNHGFLRLHATGWTLSPAYDLNPVPTDVKPRILTTRITPDDGTCSLDLVEEACGYFDLTLPQARAIIREVADATTTWRSVARAVGVRKAECDRMASAFDHADLGRALSF